MFALLFGLLGVASLMVAGHHEVQIAEKLDTAGMVGRAAFREVEIRELLDPSTWETFDETGNVVRIWQPDPANHPRRPFLIKGVHVDRFAAVLDPLGLAAPAGTFSRSFPANAPASSLYLLRISPFPLADPKVTYAVADLVFRSSHDLVVVQNLANRDLPPAQQMLGGARRASLGNHSWLATLKTAPTDSPLHNQITVSIVVFYKRDLSSSLAAEGRTTNVTVRGVSEFELGLPVHPVTNRAWSVSPGQWLMLSGSLGTGNHFQWYQVVMATQPENMSQLVTLAGPDWNPMTTNTTAYLIDNVVAVYEKHFNLKLPAESY